jgi:hypothetical protein
MPQDNSFDSEVQASPPSEDYGLSRARHWEYKLCWLPKRCFLTDKPLWGKRAYHGERWITGPGEPIVEHYWINKHEYLLWRIKGTR